MGTRARGAHSGWRAWPIDLCSDKDAGRSQHKTPTPCERARRQSQTRQDFHCGSSRVLITKHAAAQHEPNEQNSSLRHTLSLHLSFSLLSSLLLLRKLFLRNAFFWSVCFALSGILLRQVLVQWLRCTAWCAVSRTTKDQNEGVLLSIV